ncbi:GTPase [Capnocytophaga gingivalis]|jgi:putative GTPase|uniref:GTPase n=1 Tax=Capnocytophaga gingivalis TaxID=1017 RepID=UPI002B46DD44|nr:GTPase [Capnocytophaga gingivalis]MEB3013290.1 GTPase [Capnocytophaga gingivalis]
MNIEDISFLITSYLIVSDYEIHSYEIEIQKKSFSISEQAKVEHNKILSDDDGKIPMQKLIETFNSKASAQEKRKLIEALYQVAYADNFFHQNERKFIDDIIKQINFSAVEAQVICNEIEESSNKYIEKQQTFWQNIKENISKGLYSITKNDFFEDTLLNGKEFVNKVREIGVRAKEDLNITSNNIELLNKKLSEKIESIENAAKGIVKNKREDKESEEIISFVQELEDKIKNGFINEFSNNLEVLKKKKKTIDYFTIAFMGRTKAGKSTFHKVITGEETDDIGVGKLRTTRFNRVFNWENIRIVDTPGIGAPGGKADTETARSIVDEADLICYIVTNDAIQETEFNFLSELKDRNKPIFIILNIKENLENSARLRRFIKNPLQWKEDKGDKNIQGHIDRIREMIAKNNYNPDLIEIIPIQLLAALLANQKINELPKKEIEALAKGSNLEEYTKKIKQSIFRSGNLKKSQNIIDGFNYYVTNTKDSIEQERKKAEELLNSIKNKKRELNKDIDKEKQKTLLNINSAISNTFASMQGDLSSIFANKHYESKEIGKDWERFVDEKGYFKSLKIEIEDELMNFSKNIKNKIEEFFEDLQMELQYSYVNNFQTGDTTDYRFWYNFGIESATLGLSVLALANIWNPIGWAFAALAGAALLGNWLFKSKEERVRDAKEKVIKGIFPQLQKQEQEIKQNVRDAFLENISKVQGTLNQKLDYIINGLTIITSTLEEIEQESFVVQKTLNKVFVYRIFEHLGKVKIDVKGNALQEYINKNLETTKIDRSYKNSYLNVKTDFNISPKEEKEIQDLIQTDVKFEK